MIKHFIQLPMSAGPTDPAVDYRFGFEGWARRMGNPGASRVTILTLDIAEVEPLHRLWRAWPQVDIRAALPSFGTSDEKVGRIFLVEGDELRAVSADPFYAMRWAPSQQVHSTHIETVTLRELLSTAHEGESVALCVDLRAPEQAGPWTSLVGVRWFLAVTAAAPLGRGADARRDLHAEGFRPAGRPFGAAGTSFAMHRCGGLRDRLRAQVAEARVRAGSIAESLITEAGSRRQRRAVARVEGRPSTEPALDPDHGQPLQPLARCEIEAVIEKVRDQPWGTWQVLVDEGDDIDDAAYEARDRVGVFPISFSYPAALPLVTPEEQLSPIIPGFPYSFADSDAYLKEYSRASMALTFRKAGWDCFRHVEIMASGSIPLMPDAALIPPFAMIHYPKRAMERVAEVALERGGRPDAATQHSFRDYFNRHLTSLAMAEYLLRVSGLLDADRVLFVDEQTPVNPEYQSTLALIGLKEILGTRCEVAFPADFLYRGSSASAARHYGRGFGYSHAIAADSRTDSEAAGDTGHGLEDLGAYEVIVVGSVSRNALLTRRILDRVDPSRVIAIHGEDGPPTVTATQELRALGAHVFVRAIHTRS